MASRNPHVLADVLTQLIMRHFWRELFIYRFSTLIIRKTYKRREPRKRMWLTAAGFSDYDGVRILTDTHDINYYYENYGPCPPLIGKKFLKYHAYAVYLKNFFANWVSRCKGHPETFYQELPKVAYKLMLKQPISNVDFKSEFQVLSTLIQSESQVHKPPTHVDKKFYDWLVKICTDKLLME